MLQADALLDSRLKSVDKIVLAALSYMELSLPDNEALENISVNQISDKINVSRPNFLPALQKLHDLGYITMNKTGTNIEVITNKNMVYVDKQLSSSLQNDGPELSINLQELSNNLQNENCLTKGNIRKEKNAEKSTAPTAKEFIPPTLGEISEYVKKKELMVDPLFFLDYFEASEPVWHDKSGSPVKCWKRKLLTWDKAEKARSIAQNVSQGISGGIIKKERLDLMDLNEFKDQNGLSRDDKFKKFEADMKILNKKQEINLAEEWGKR